MWLKAIRRLEGLQVLVQLDPWFRPSEERSHVGGQRWVVEVLVPINLKVSLSLGFSRQIEEQTANRAAFLCWVRPKNPSLSKLTFGTDKQGWWCLSGSIGDKQKLSASLLSRLGLQDEEARSACLALLSVLEDWCSETIVSPSFKPHVLLLVAVFFWQFLSWW